MRKPKGVKTQPEEQNQTKVRRLQATTKKEPRQEET